jgi:NAD(P)-dependent dehydrogenase (short-subunit alcohol dehydrogenase family)
MNRLLEDKIAIITSASRGIGAATAHAFARAGATVVLAARSQPELHALAADITADAAKALAVPTDVTDPASVQALVERTVATHGRLDAAFNNAGDGHQPVPLAELALEEFGHVLAVNARGVFLALKHEIAAMRANCGGAIVNMTSTAGVRGVKGIAAYVTGKHAIVGLTKTAVLDYAKDGIRVNAVAPGPIDSHRLEHLPPQVRACVAGQLTANHRVSTPVNWQAGEDVIIAGSVSNDEAGQLYPNGWESPLPYLRVVAQP